MRPMNFQKILVPGGGIVLLGLAWRSYGWAGVALTGGAIVMFLLLHFNRAMQVLKRAAERPVGYVASAVMLNAKLKPKAPLVHVVAMTRSLGQRLSEEGQSPEIYRWTDGTQSHVTCEFVAGRLMKWELQRPEQKEDTAADSQATDRTSEPTSL